jgi:hypothetical protein
MISLNTSISQQNDIVELKNFILIEKWKMRISMDKVFKKLFWF